MKKITAKKKLDVTIETVYYMHGRGVSLMIHDIAALFQSARDAYSVEATHETGLKAIERSVIESIATYRQSN